MLITTDTICAIATASGQGAIGVVRLSGPQALALLQQASRRMRFTPRRLTGVQLYAVDNHVVDQALAAYMPAPNSFTGEAVVEVYGHGGVLNMQQILSLFVQLGARLAEPGEFTRRAFEHGKLDLTQAEAVATIIAARSDRALRNAQAILGGQLGTRVRQIRQALIGLAANLEACIDFADELNLAPPTAQLAQAHLKIMDEIQALASTYQVGKRLNGITVALLGPVNAGKSSLMNALLGQQRVIVSPEPGTTRDYVEATTMWDGLAVTLIDTAGARDQAEMTAAERIGFDLATDRIATCDLFIHMVDIYKTNDFSLLTHSPTCLFTELSTGIHHLWVLNKADLLTAEQTQDKCAQVSAFLGTQVQRQVPVLATSTTDGTGLAALQAAIVHAALGHPSGTGDTDLGGDGAAEHVYVTEQRHWELLKQAEQATIAGLAALQSALPPEAVVEHTRHALTYLGQITGEHYTESVLDALFSTFCIGK